MRKRRSLTALERELTFEHWKIQYDWDGIDPCIMAARHECSRDDVLTVMNRIQKKFPNPNPTHDEFLASKAATGSICQYCERPIVWINRRPCEPSIQRFICADGKIYTGRVLHQCSSDTN